MTINPCGRIDMASTELQNKFSALKRYGVTAGGTALTIMAVLQLLSPEQVTEIKAQAEILNQSIITGYGALTKMWIIAGPVAVGFAVKMGWNSSSVQALAGKLLGIAKNDQDPKATEAKVALVNAAASPDIGSQGVVNKELAANPLTAGNVVAAPTMMPPQQAPAA